MNSISSSLAVTAAPGARRFTGSCNHTDEFLGNTCRTNLSFHSNRARDLQLSSSRRLTTIRAGYSDDGKPSSASIFVGGFVLGGVIVGALGCIFAPQISKALAATDRKDLMRKLPKFIYDEEKALEKTRKVLTEKIAQLNSAIDEVSAQLRSEESPDATSVDPDEVEAPA
ncbi:uncharacterized protein LOC116213429 isoform X4 [Punica granatum]|uniref:Uncharacterized protein LOC116213429 isoform X4 n=1 Tax=Punica granatum TaxID=22663 RepID=A0A218WCJ0_PUNGR|nr:uncharacterized protein LOC116213429 isoform X4 [Punica granatum]OWM70564.1 hypothetical protein CDL15_Pgr014237 [Punica granatum]